MKKWSFILLFLASCAQQQTTTESLVGIQIYDRNGMTETISNHDRLEVYDRINFFTSQPYQKVVRVFRSEGKNNSKITTYHPNGTLWQYLEAEEMRAHGAYKEWHSNGVLKIEAMVIGGTADVALGSQHDWLFDGSSRVWNEKGILIAEMGYIKGSLQGLTRHYYDSGALKKELPYVNHLLDGEGIEYHLNGSIKAKLQFKKDLQNGSSLGYFESGEIAWVETWLNGTLQEGFYFNPDGTKLSIIENGNGFRIVFDDAVVTQWVEIKDGKPEGLIKNYHHDGHLLSVYSVKEGKKQGEETIYFADGSSPKLKIQWDADLIHGMVKTWYSNGKLQSEREFGRNKKMGTSIAWYPNGNLMLVEEYENDTLIKGRYYKKGQKDPISLIQNGTGIAHLYDEEGILIRKVQYMKGKAVDPES